MPILQERDFLKALDTSRPRISVRRAQLYQAQLDWARGRLDAIATNAAYHAANLPAGVWKTEITNHRAGRNPPATMAYNVFARALTGKKRLKLMVNLARQLDPWAAYYINQTRTAPGVAPAIANAATYQLLVNQIIAAGPFAVPGLGGAPNAVSVSIARLTEHFVNNLTTMCARVFVNWVDINEAFSPLIPWMTAAGLGPPALEHVEEFRPTGSDYHKGGQQVVLIDFALLPQRLGPSHRTNKRHNHGRLARMVRRLANNGNQLGADEYGIERIVYKPGDVELDCRMVGNSAVVTAIAPTGYNQAASLSELINGYLASPTPRSLPTYVILPYHAGSTLAAAANWAAAPGNPVVNIRQSYGYLQFLTHAPELEDDLDCPDSDPTLQALASRLAAYQKPNWLAETDFITTNPIHTHDYFFIWGQLLAMAVTFSLSDLHSQNTIVHRDPYPRNAAAYPPANSTPKPHLIDLEDGCKYPMGALANTAIPGGNLNKVRLGEQRLQVINDKTVNVAANFVPTPTEHEKNQCFLFAAGAVTRLRADANGRQAIGEGFLAVMEAFCNQNVPLRAWTAGLANVIARFVPLPTAEFYLRLFFWGDETRTLVARRTSRMNSTRTDWNNAEAGAPDDVRRMWDIAHPFFALEHNDHDFFDFENRDVPYFVHALGHNELLNSRGHKVTPSVVDPWQLANGTTVALNANSGRRNPAAVPPGNFTPGTLASYFPDTAINAVDAQVAALLPGVPFYDRVTKLLQEILRIPSYAVNNAFMNEGPLAGDGQLPAAVTRFAGTVNGVVVRPVAVGAGHFYEWQPGAPAIPAGPGVLAVAAVPGQWNVLDGPGGPLLYNHVQW